MFSYLTAHTKPKKKNLTCHSIALSILVQNETNRKQNIYVTHKTGTFKNVFNQIYEYQRHQYTDYMYKCTSYNNEADKHNKNMSTKETPFQHTSKTELWMLFLFVFVCLVFLCNCLLVVVHGIWHRSSNC